MATNNVASLSKEAKSTRKTKGLTMILLLATTALGIAVMNNEMLNSSRFNQFKAISIS